MGDMLCMNAFFLCTLFILYVYARRRFHQKMIGHVMWILEAMCDLCISECVVVLLQNPLCIRVYSRPCTHVIFNPNKECTPQGQSRSLKHSRHPTNLCRWLIKQITLHIIGKEGSAILVASAKNLTWIALGKKPQRSTSKHPPNPMIGTWHYKPMTNSMKLCKTFTKWK